MLLPPVALQGWEGILATTWGKGTMTHWTTTYLGPDPWETCNQVDERCTGVRVGDLDRCLKHLTEDELGDFLSQLHAGSSVDARGTVVDEHLLQRLLTAIKNDEGTPQFEVAAFIRTRFVGTAVLSNCQFTGAAIFMRAVFEQEAHFNNARFLGDARFDSAVFQQFVSFNDAVFYDTAFFGDAEFREAGSGSGSAQFINANFKQLAQFAKAEFAGRAWFERTHFEGDTYFPESTAGTFNFHDSRFEQLSSIAGAKCEVGDFTGSTFARAEQLGPIRATRRLHLDGTRFGSFVAVEAATSLVSCALAVFEAGVTLRLRWANVILDGAVFKEASTLTPAPVFFRSAVYPLFDEQDTPLFDESTSSFSGSSSIPRLLSIRGVDVSRLVVSDVDLQACIFQEVHNLDQLRIEGPRPFADAPSGWKTGRVGGQGLPIWHWTRRQVIAEEHQWRASRLLPRAPNGRQHPKAQGWYPAECQFLQPTWPLLLKRPPQLLGPERLASVYRSLRRAQEDRRNEPGAADFYYGEMEMRRLSRKTP